MIELVVPVFVALIGGCALVVGPIALAVYQNRATRTRHDHLAVKLEEVRENVSNDHRTNLRDDVDRALAGIDQIQAFQSQLGANAARLRGEVRSVMGHQREHEAASALLVGALRESDRRILDELRRHHPAVPDYDDLTSGQTVVDLEADPLLDDTGG